MEKFDWEFIENFIHKVLMDVSSSLDDKIIGYVLHYLKHDEFEMAFEILFLEIMNLGIKIHDNKLLQDAKKVAMDLMLHEESIYDLNFWYNFMAYIE